MKKTVKAIAMLIFTGFIAVALPLGAKAVNNGEDDIFAVSFTADGQLFTVKCEHQHKLLGSEWYFKKPDYLQKADKDDVLCLVLPHDALSVQLKAAEDTSGVYLDGVAVNGGDSLFLADGSVHTLSANGENYTLNVHYGSDIPTMYIDVESGNLDYIYESKYNKESAYMTIVADGETLYSKELDFIKGRGNFTWDSVPKKSFSIKLIEEADLLGMGEAKSYALLANHVDMTMVRNKLICDFAADIGVNYPIESQYVDLYINNEYYGLYALTEKVEVNESRVDIYNLEEETEKLNLYDLPSDAKPMGDQKDLSQYNPGGYKWVDVKNNPQNISGGYIIEIELQERYIGENSGFVSDYGQTVNLSSPAYASKEQVEYIKDYYQQFEDAVVAENGYNSQGKHYSEYVDVDSLVKMHLIHEFAKNLDVAITSFYFCKDIDGKLVAAPVWDMDSGFGRYFERYGTDFESPEGLWASGSRMWGKLVEDKYTIISLLWRHEDYRLAVFNEWHTNFVPKIDSLLADFDSLSLSVEKSRINDRQMWLGGNNTDESIQRQCEDSDQFVKDFITRRSEYLSGVYNEDNLRVVYEANGGWDFTIDGELYPAGSSAVVQENRFRYDGADFIGWNTKADGSGTEYQPHDTFEITEDTTLYAQWSLHPVAETPAEEGGITGLIKKIIRKIFG